MAGALDRSRRLISTAAAASDGAVQICKEYPYECKETNSVHMTVTAMPMSMPIPIAVSGPSAADVSMPVSVSVCESGPVSRPPSRVPGPGRYLRSAHRR